MSSSRNIDSHLWYVRRVGNNPIVLKKASCQPYNANVTQGLRIAHDVNTYRGGKIQFGNYYLLPSQRPGLNYLGRSEGMPGGSGAPIKNKF